MKMNQEQEIINSSLKLRRAALKTNSKPKINDKIVNKNLLSHKF